MVGGWVEEQFQDHAERFFYKTFFKEHFLVRYLFNKFKFIFIKLFTKPSPNENKTERWLKIIIVKMLINYLNC